MLEQILFNLRVRGNFSDDQRLLAAVSGGPDSLVLLDALWRLGVPLVVAHLNHLLRPQAGDDLRFVQQAAAERGLPFAGAQADAGAYARLHGLSIEEAARTLRYRFLFESAAAHGCAAVATGHTADDQAETVLMHLLRGAGPSGLSGMAFRSLPNPWSQSIALLRPLLDLPRQAILDYLAVHALQPVHDATNDDLRYYRNRLRHETLPYLEQLNPGVRGRLVRMAQVIGDEDRLLDQLTAAAWQQIDARTAGESVSLDRAAFNRQPPALQRRLLRQALEVLRPGLRDIDFERVEAARRFAAAPPRSRQADLVAGLRLLDEGGRLVIAAWEADLPDGGWPQAPPVETRIALPGRLALQDGWLLQADLLPADRLPPGVDAQALAAANTDPYTAYLDLERLPGPPALRRRRAGDRFRPLGLQGHSLKLSDFMINQRLPRRARPAWPLLTVAGQVAWLPGYRIAQPFAAGPATRRLLVLRLYRPPAADETPEG
ncbi:MAG: tRNA lysidine(34) synthetase TilS [Chloroflexota bacterium]